MVFPRITMAFMLFLLFFSAGQASGRRGANAVPVSKKAPEAAKIGRYQLLPVEYTSNDLINESAVTRKDLILLDTVTGNMQICSQKIWTNVAGGKDISERKCLPFETYAEYPVGTLKGKKMREGDSPRP